MDRFLNRGTDVSDEDWLEILRRYFDEPTADVEWLEKRLRQRAKERTAWEVAYVIAEKAMKVGFEQASLALA